ncbi:ribosomal protein L17 [Pisolithus orientalis]|uniref:ribosomal protein L17 n=1 Tax=Pisolithus orientalis TaxID=936130 RepID=UPI002224CC8E|nr:ribosomal protein L17 [Pisolithus orientalis]KAI6005295.1 ribosomal protein L17 [Pisolithus orientalis]
MKHGVAFRKFSRTSSHRNLMLRNLVTALFEHEQIRTTLPKAKDTARLAEKIISLGKRGSESAYNRAQAFVLKPAVLPKLFETFAQRYAKRPGGYTRIHRIDNRTGDNAPMALLELVDNPRDFKFEMTARAVGRDLLTEQLRWNSPRTVLNSGVDATQSIAKEVMLSAREKGELRPSTRINLQKVVKYRGSSALKEIGKRASAWVETLLAIPLQQKKMQIAADASAAAKYKAQTSNYVEKFPKTTIRAGAAVPGDVRSAMRLAKGAIARPRRPPRSISLPSPARYDSQTLHRQ